MIETFEYATDDDLRAVWTPSGNAVISASDTVASNSTGKKSMRVDFSFPSVAWATETVTGPSLTSALSIAPNQYLTMRLRGDPAFATADFSTFFLYVYDTDGNFSRWGTPVPKTTDWQVLNFAASSIEAPPWNSPGLPDLTRVDHFAFFQYGSETAIPAYTATIYIDDLMLRDTPLTEFPAPAAPRALIDDFEGYANDAALRSFYTYENSPATTTTAASLDTAAPQGKQGLKLAIDFAAGQYPWGSVRSGIVPAFSLPTNAVVSLRLKGDASLAAVADNGTTFWLSFYDKAGGRITYSTPAAPVIASDWTTLQATFQDFGDTSTVDIGNLVQWRILVEGWTGTAETPAASAAIYVDDIRITVPATVQPTLAVTLEAGTLKFAMDHLAAGTVYDLRTSTDFANWTTANTVSATGPTASCTLAPNKSWAFFRLVEKTL